MLIRDLLIGMILASVFVMIFGVAWSENSINYNQEIDARYQSTFQEFNSSYSSMTEMTKDLTEKTSSSEVDTESTDLFGSMARGSYAATKLTFSIPRIITSTLSNVADILQINPVFVVATIAIIFITIVFIIVSGFMQNKI